MMEEKIEQILVTAGLLSRQSDFNEVLRIVSQKAASIVKADTALVMMINPATRETVKTVYRQGTGQEKDSYNLIHAYLTGWTIENGSGFFSENIKKDNRFRQELFVNNSVGSVICTPLWSRGMIIGSLLLMNHPEGNLFSSEDFDLLEKLAGVVSPYLHNTRDLQEYFNAPIREESLLTKYRAHGLLGKSEKFIELLQSVEATAACDVRVLLEGQSGTGKELVARAIHHFSNRVSSKFIAIDCGAIPSELIESELFGHTKGAFTGAGEARKGLIEEAAGGTLFMDEISNLPLGVQAKLLRVLQEKEIRPVGSNSTRKIDVRIIAASSRSLRELVEKNEFREDLFYRLYVYPIEIPSLSERKSDIALLANHFLKKFASEQKKQAGSFSEELVDHLKSRAWQGNVRELENYIERLVTLSPADQRVIDISIIPGRDPDKAPEQKQDPSRAPGGSSLRETLVENEKQAIIRALEESGWNQSAAARKLEISEHAIRYKMNKLGIRKS